VDDERFLTIGGVGRGGLNVLRVSTGDQTQIDLEDLDRVIHNGSFSRLQTVNTDGMIALNRLTVATLVDYVGEFISEFDDDVPEDVRNAHVTAAQQLSQSSSP